MRTLLRSLSHSHAHNASECVRSHCASMCACVCAHFCKYFFSLLHSFSPPLFAFFSAQKPFLRYSIAVYNQIEIKRWITIITYNHHAYLVWLELRFMFTPYGKMNYYSKKLCFSSKNYGWKTKDLYGIANEMYSNSWTWIGGIAPIFWNSGRCWWKQIENYHSFMLSMIDIHEWSMNIPRSWMELTANRPYVVKHVSNGCGLMASWF